MKQLRKVFILLGVFVASAGIGAIATNYTFHRLRAWDAEGNWCTRVTPNGGIERRYGAACDEG